MVAGLKFLSKKNFNPQNLSNQKQVWEARQQQQNEAKRAKEREDQLRREKDEEELARARGGDRGGNQASLRFMYAPPPGMTAPASGDAAGDNAAGTHDQYGAANDLSIIPPSATSNVAQLERQPGDDDAAAEFRRMLAAATPSEGADEAGVGGTVDAPGAFDSTLSGAALSGTSMEAAAIAGKNSKDNRTALEKAVGRKDAGASLTLEEQIARFPQLKHAPMAKGMSTTNVGVTFKPLGTQLRNVRCLACGVWGHSRGDRECEKSGWNPFAAKSSGLAATPDASSSYMRPQMEERIRNNAESSSLERKRRHLRDYSDGSGDSEDSYQKRERKRTRKHKRRHRESSTRRKRSRSPSPDDRHRRSRKESRKSHRKSSRRDDD